MTPPDPQVALAQIREDPLSVDEVLAAVDHPHAGAVVTFVGQVRDHDAARPVVALEYSAHPSAGQVAADLAARYAAAARPSGADPDTGADPDPGAVVRVAVVHRVGALRVGDLAIVAAVSAAHRGEAFRVCQALVDEFKATVPIWKHQLFADGSDEWVGVA